MNFWWILGEHITNKGNKLESHGIVNDTNITVMRTPKATYFAICTRTYKSCEECIIMQRLKSEPLFLIWTDEFIFRHSIFFLKLWQLPLLYINAMQNRLSSCFQYWNKYEKITHSFVTWIWNFYCTAHSLKGKFYILNKDQLLFHLIYYKRIWVSDFYAMFPQPIP